ncbi:MAG: hypothetical protein ACLRXQ_09375 [Phascolarctobacterium faecium]
MLVRYDENQATRAVEEAVTRMSFGVVHDAGRRIDSGTEGEWTP